MAEVERVRVDKFTWERLLLVSALPWETRSVAHVMAIYMSSNGAKARPGIENLVAATRLSDRSIKRHLAATVSAGYLKLAERGGFRGAERVPRASVYAATVPKDVYDIRDRLLASPPWRSAPRPEANVPSVAPSVNVSPVAPSVGDVGDGAQAKVPNAQAKVPNGVGEGATGDTPSILLSSIHLSSISTPNFADLENRGRPKAAPPSRSANEPHQFLEGLDGGYCVCGLDRKDPMHVVRTPARRRGALSA